VRIAVDARYGNILEVRPVAAAQPYRPQPYYGPLYPSARVVAPDFYDDGSPPPPRTLPTAPGTPNPAVRPVQPHDQSAAVTPARPPIPRPKPPATPAAVKPKPAGPQTAPPAAAVPESPPGEAAAKPEAPALPPVAPLE